MKTTVTLLALVWLGLSGKPVAAGESPDNPAAPKRAAVSMGYFCHADTLDHSAYYITGSSSEPQPYDPKFIRKLSTEWTAYLGQTYGTRNISYPICEEAASTQISATIERFKQSHKQTQPKVPIVELSWHSGVAAAATGSASPQPAAQPTPQAGQRQR